MKKQFYDLTPRMVQDFFQNVDAYLECNCEHKLADLLMEMNVFEKQIIKGLYDRAHDLNQISADQAAFLAQKDTAGGKTTMNAYLWKLEGEAYDANH